MSKQPKTDWKEELFHAHQALDELSAPMRFVEEGQDVLLVNAEGMNTARYVEGRVSDTTRNTVTAVNALAFILKAFDDVLIRDIGLPWELKDGGEWLILDRHGNTVVDCSGDFERRGDQSLAEDRAAFIVRLVDLLRLFYPGLDARAESERRHREFVAKLVEEHATRVAHAQLVAGFELSPDERTDLEDRIRKAMLTLHSRPDSEGMDGEAARIAVETINGYLRDVNDRCTKEGQPLRFPPPAPGAGVPFPGPAEPEPEPGTGVMQTPAADERERRSQLSELIGALTEQSRTLDDFRRVLTSLNERMARVENGRESLIGRLERLEARPAPVDPGADALVAKMEAAATARSEGRPVP